MRWKKRRKKQRSKNQNDRKIRPKPKVRKNQPNKRSATKRSGSNLFPTPRLLDALGKVLGFFF